MWLTTGCPWPLRCCGKIDNPILWVDGRKAFQIQFVMRMSQIAEIGRNIQFQRHPWERIQNHQPIHFG